MESRQMKCTGANLEHLNKPLILYISDEFDFVFIGG